MPTERYPWRTERDPNKLVQMPTSYYKEKHSMKNSDLSRAIGVYPAIITMIVVGIISVFLASDIVSAFGLQLVKKQLPGKSEMSLAQEKISTRSDIQTNDQSQPARFETATFGLG